MRKYIILLAVTICLLSCATAAAQQKGFTSSYWAHGAIPFEKDGAIRTSFDVSIGYNFNSRFSLQALVVPDTALFSKGGINTFENSMLFGLSCSYMFHGRNHKDDHELIAAAANTVLADNYRFNYFDIGYRNNQRIGKTDVRLFYGIGIKYYNSQRAAFANSTAFYMTVGVRFN